MKPLIRCFVVLMLCGASAALADSPARDPKSPDLSSLQNPSVVTQFLDRVDSVVQMLSGKAIDVARAVSVAQQIEARTEFDLVKEADGKTIVFEPATRSRAAKELLSPARYSALENACVHQLQASNEVARILSMRVLAQSLGSSAGKLHMEGVLNKGLKALQGSGELPISPKELFAAAEGLAYLGSSDGVDVLKSVLRSDDSPPFLKRRAIEALAYLGIPVTSGSAADLLLSDDAAVAYTAFDSAGTPSTNHLVISAAITQIQKLQTAYANKQALSHNQAALLAKVALILKLASREGGLSDGELHDVRTAVVFFAGVRDEDIQERVVSLFAGLANDEDSALIARLLSNDSARVRSRAALAISRCSPETIRNQRKALIGLLDDNSGDVRNFALYALRKGLGEKAGNYLSDAEYEIQKAKVLEKYKE